MSLLNYKKFKLFAISVLWRASVASGELFSTVNLGSKHESRLRQMIVDGDPGEPHEYGCAILPLSSDDLEGKTVEAILSPDRIRLEGHTAYRFLFGSAIWIFIVSSHSSSFPRMEFLLNETGSILMPVIKAEETELFTRLASELRNQGKLGNAPN